MRPLLAYGQDGGEKNINEAIAAIANHLRLSDDDRALLIPSGKQTLLGNRVHWARTYLDKAGAASLLSNLAMQSGADRVIHIRFNERSAVGTKKVCFQDQAVQVLEVRAWGKMIKLKK